MTKTPSQIREIVEDAIKFSIKYQNTTHIEIEHNEMLDVIAAFNDIAEESDYDTCGDGNVADFYGVMENGDEYRVGVELVNR